MTLNLYKSPVYALLAACCSIAAAALLVVSFRLSAENGSGDFLAFMAIIGAMVSIICALVFVALAYVNWVPRWERDEKKTGRFPGDEEKA
jgi:hypothetical protein